MKTNRIRQNVLPVLAAFIWGTGFVAQSVGADYLAAFSFNAARSIVAFFFLLAVCAVRRRLGRTAPTTRRDLLIAGGCCGAALAAAAYFQQKGMETTTSGKAGFITALYIVIVPVLSVFFRKKPPRTIWLSVALAVAGLYCLCVTGDLTIATGDFYVLICALCFSLQILAIDYFAERTDGVEMSCVQFLTSSVLSALGAALTGESATLSALRLCAWPILYAGVLSSGVGYTLQILAQKGANPTVVSLLLSLESVFATLAGAVILHDRMSAREYLGCGLMLLAVVLAQLPERPKAVN